jgi:hypothetical protein
VKKLRKSMESKGEGKFTLSLSSENVCNFCYWVGREEGKRSRQDVMARTLEKYLYGLKAWHLYHQAKYPSITNTILKVILRALAKKDSEEPPKEKKGTVRIDHLVTIANSLWRRNLEESALLDLSLMTFWSLAFLGEITYATGEGPPNACNKVRVKEAALEEKGPEKKKAFIYLKNNKTRKRSGIGRKGPREKEGIHLLEEH